MLAENYEGLEKTLMRSVFYGVVYAQDDKNSTNYLWKKNRFPHHEGVENDSPYRDEVEVEHGLCDPYPFKPFVPEDMT